MKTVAAVIMGFCGFTGLIYLIQGALIFFPVRIDRQALQAIKKNFPQAEELTITAADKKKLHGWLVKPEGAVKPPLVIYFGGNAEEVSWLIAEAPRLEGWAVCLVNYRGYGISEGRPGEQALYGDALAVYDSLARRADIDAERIVVMGRSIGTGVATYLAQHRPITGAILICPFDSLVSIGRKHYPFLPVSLLLRHRFDSLSRAASIKAPMLALAARDDEIVPRESFLRLIEQWGGPHKTVLIDGGHNTLQEFPGYWESIRQFLAHR
jgi:pimeloyl-ACP methyl ester carboxylesterase